jgi:hypothetical protein
MCLVAREIGQDGTKHFANRYDTAFGNLGASIELVR